MPFYEITCFGVIVDDLAKCHHCNAAILSNDGDVKAMVGKKINNKLHDMRYVDLCPINRKSLTSFEWLTCVVFLETPVAIKAIKETSDNLTKVGILKDDKGNLTHIVGNVRWSSQAWIKIATVSGKDICILGLHPRSPTYITDKKPVVVPSAWKVKTTNTDGTSFITTKKSVTLFPVGGNTILMYDWMLYSEVKWSEGYERYLNSEHFHLVFVDCTSASMDVKAHLNVFQVVNGVLMIGKLVREDLFLMILAVSNKNDEVEFCLPILDPEQVMMFHIQKDIPETEFGKGIDGERSLKVYLDSIDPVS